MVDISPSLPFIIILFLEVDLHFRQSENFFASSVLHVLKVDYRYTYNTFQCCTKVGLAIIESRSY